MGDGKPYIAALVTADPETLSQWKADNGKPETATIADLNDDPALRAEIQAAVDEANKAVSHAEAIKKFVILGGVMGKAPLDAGGVKALAALPSLDELRAKIIGLIQAPATKVAQLVNAPAAKVARVVHAYASKSEAQ